MVLFLSFIWIFSVSGLLVEIFKKRFEIVVPISFIICGFILYPFGFIKHLSYGFYFSWTLVIAFFVILIYWFIKRKDKLIEFKENYFTVGFFVFVALFVFAYFVGIGRGFNYWDEFGHWGPMVKESLRTDNFYCSQLSTLQRHKDYPPFISLLELMWCYFGGMEYKEGYIFVSLISFTFSLFMPIFSKLNKKNFLKGVIGFVGIILVCLTINRSVTASDYAHIFNSVYMDWVMAIFLAYSLFTVFNSEWDLLSFINISLCLTTLLMMKQMGLPFYLLVILFIVLKLIFIDKKVNKKNVLISIGLFVVIPFVVYISWKFVTNYFGVANGQFQISQIKIKDLFGIIKGTSGEPWQHEAYVNFIDAILHRKLYIHPFGISYFVFGILMSILIVLVLRFTKKSFFIGGTYLFGLFAYAFAMMLLYMFSFGPYEGPELASFDRYLTSYLFVGITLLFMLLYYEYSDYEKSIVVLSIGVVSLLLFVEWNDFQYLIPGYNNDRIVKSDVPLNDILNIQCLNKDDKVLIIEQDVTDNKVDALLNYYKNDNYEVVKVGPPTYEGEETLYVDIDTWKSILDNYDYIYVLKSDGYLENDYIKPLSNTSIYEGALYKIKHGDTGNYFEIVSISR